MGTLTTNKKVNPSQLTYELEQAYGGTRALRVVGPYADGTTKVDAPGTGETSLQAVVDAHNASNNWTHPNPPPPSEAEVEETQTRTQMDQIRTKAKAVFAGNDTFTAPQVQKILAALVLRETR